MREQASKRKKESERAGGGGSLNKGDVAQIPRENSALKEPGWLLTSVAVSTDAKHLHEVNIELYFPSVQYVKTKTLVWLFICLLYLSRRSPSALKSSAILSWSRKKQVADPKHSPHLSHSW